MMLADMGARVIRIDRAGAVGGPAPRGDLLARGRESVAVDLKNPAGVATVLDLVAQADVVLEGFAQALWSVWGSVPMSAWSEIRA